MLKQFLVSLFPKELPAVLWDGGSLAVVIILFLIVVMMLWKALNDVLVKKLVGKIDVGSRPVLLLLFGVPLVISPVLGWPITAVVILLTAAAAWALHRKKVEVLRWRFVSLYLAILVVSLAAEGLYRQWRIEKENEAIQVYLVLPFKSDADVQPQRYSETLRKTLASVFSSDHSSPVKIQPERFDPTNDGSVDLPRSLRELKRSSLVADLILENEARVFRRDGQPTRVILLTEAYPPGNLGRLSRIRDIGIDPQQIPYLTLRTSFRLLREIRSLPNSPINPTAELGIKKRIAQEYEKILLESGVPRGKIPSEEIRLLLAASTISDQEIRDLLLTHSSLATEEELSQAEQEILDEITDQQEQRQEALLGQLLVGS